MGRLTSRAPGRSGGRRINARFYVGKSRGRAGFEACVNFGGSGKGTIIRMQCARGKNPRKALAAALHQAARVIGKRRGAFEGRR